MTVLSARCLCISRGRAISLLAALIVLLAPGRAVAQFSEWWSVDEAAAGGRINLAATWEGPDLLQGIEVEVSGEAELVDVANLRFGRDRLSQRTAHRNGVYHILFEDVRRGPHELLLTVALPASGISVDWRVTPIVADDDYTLARGSHLEQRGLVELQPALRQAAGSAAEFGAESPPVLLEGRALPLIDYSAPFEVNLWLKTTALNQIVLSTWSGSESSSYPLELVIGPAGRLIMYRGHPGRHEAISSRRPVADGRWHEVNVSFNGTTTVLRVDGVAADSTSMHFAPVDIPTTFVLGGRATSAPDSLRQTFTGWLDDVSISGRAARPADGHARTVLSFEDGIPEDLLTAGSSGPAVVASDRVRVTPPHSFRAEVQHGRVQLRWQAEVAAGGTLLVERSRDGRKFEVVEEVAIDARDNDDIFYAEDASLGDAVRYYRICHLLPEGPRLYTRMLKVGLAPEDSETVQIIGNFPNPFSTSTTIAFRINDAQDVEVSVWDLSGQQVEILLNGTQPEGLHEVLFDASDLPSGTYFVRLQTPSRHVSHKMIVAR